MLRTRERTLTPSPSVIFTFRLAVESIKKLGGASYHAHLKPLKNIDSYVKMYYKFHLFKFLPFLTLFVSPCPTYGHPFEVFSIHFDNCLQHGFKVLQQKIPLPKCILSFIYPLVLQLRPLLFSSSFIINPSYHLSSLRSTHLLC
jgi:hypothetical protein